MLRYIWKRDNNGHAHLENAMLLAYTRGQLAADAVLIVQQHCAKCTVCTQKCAHYTRIGITLQKNLTYTMPVYPSIVDMLGSALDSPAAASAALQQRRENEQRVRKQRARTSGSRPMRLLPAIGVLPLMIIFVSLLIVGVLAFTSSNNGNSSSGTLTSGNKAGPPNNGATLPVKPTVTSVPTFESGHTATPATTVVVTPTGTVTPPATTKPVIWICSSNADLAQSRLRICGKNFKAGDKVIVLQVLPGTRHKWGTVAIADAQGSITGAWTIQNCHNVPYAVFAYDVTGAFPTPLIPVTVALGGCRAPNVKMSVL